MERIVQQPEEQKKTERKKSPVWLRVALAAAVATGAASLSGCEAMTPQERYSQELERVDKENQFLTPELINRSPESFIDEEIEVTGEVRDIKEESRLIPMPYPQYNPLTKTTEIKISLSEETITTASLVGKEEKIEILDAQGGAYLPIPIVPAGESVVTSLNEEQTIIGSWEKNDQGGYYLRIMIVKPKLDNK